MKAYTIQFNHITDLLDATVYYMKAGIHFVASESELTITLTGGY